jgi:uncharacterized protein YndB with AHSA1/START domain
MNFFTNKIHDMQKISFSTSIEAPREVVWKALWDEASYSKWTSAFAEGSYAVTDNWKQGSKVLFLSPDGCGMVSMVAENRPNEYMSFEHLGEVKDGVEDTTSEKVAAWKGGHENYTLREDGEATILDVEMDITEEHRAYFFQTWPKALEAVKSLAEQHQIVPQ